MDEKILDHFGMKLLQNPKREMQLDGSIKEIYNQPERSKREDQIEKHSFLGPVRRMTRPDLDAVL